MGGGCSHIELCRGEESVNTHWTVTVVGAYQLCDCSFNSCSKIRW
jgi:hypothetical protein